MGDITIIDGGGVPDLQGQTAHIDLIETINAQEKLGVVVRLERKAHVIGLNLQNKDYRALMEALENAGIPKRFTQTEGFVPPLYLTERNPSIVDVDKVDVTLVYEHFMSCGQLPDKPLQGVDQSGTPSPVVYGEWKGILQQVQTNRDVNGAMLALEHTYDSDDPDFAGSTKYQTGEINTMSIQKTVNYKLLIKTETPRATQIALLNKLNEDSWLDGDARTWLCTVCDFKPLNPLGTIDDDNPPRWQFTIEFQYNHDGWDPTAVFMDERTGRPPTGLVEGVGYKTVQKLGEANFEDELGVTMK